MRYHLPVRSQANQKPSILKNASFIPSDSLILKKFYKFLIVWTPGGKFVIISRLLHSYILSMILCTYLIEWAVWRDRPPPPYPSSDSSKMFYPWKYFISSFRPPIFLTTFCKSLMVQTALRKFIRIGVWHT